jgi:hypothetical protein
MGIALHVGPSWPEHRQPRSCEVRRRGPAVNLSRGSRGWPPAADPDLRCAGQAGGGDGRGGAGRSRR